MKQPKEKQVPSSRKITYSSTQSDPTTSTMSKIIGQTLNKFANETGGDMEHINGNLEDHEDCEDLDNS